jgi:hypothetical protein
MNEPPWRLLFLPATSGLDGESYRNFKRGR